MLKRSSEVSITTNTGIVNFSKKLIELCGMTKAIDLSVRLSYTQGATQWSYGLPQLEGWGLELSFTIPQKSLTSQG